MSSSRVSQCKMGISIHVERFNFLNNCNQIGLGKLQMGGGNTIVFDVRRNVFVVREGSGKRFEWMFGHLNKQVGHAMRLPDRLAGFARYRLSCGVATFRKYLSSG